MDIKSNLILLCLSFICTTGTVLRTNAAEPEYLYIHTFAQPEGQSVPLDGLGKITFSENEMIIHTTDGKEMEVGFTDLQKLTFNSSAGIEQATTGQDISIAYRPSDKTVTVESPLPVMSLRVFNINGMLLRESSPSETCATEQLDGLPKGIYIVYAHNGETAKTQKIIIN